MKTNKAQMQEQALSGQEHSVMEAKDKECAWLRDQLVAEHEHNEVKMRDLGQERDLLKELEPSQASM